MYGCVVVLKRLTGKSLWNGSEKIFIGELKVSGTELYFQTKVRWSLETLNVENFNVFMSIYRAIHCRNCPHTVVWYASPDHDRKFSLGRWTVVVRFKRRGSVENKPHTGRHRLLDERETMGLVRLVRSDRMTPLKDKHNLWTRPRPFSAKYKSDYCFQRPPDFRLKI
jgi:hypothetical protein